MGHTSVSDLLITNATVLLEDGPLPGWLYATDGLIRAVGNGAPPPADGADHLDAAGGTLAPGFIDVHVHGAMGHETMDASPDGLHAMARFYAEHGVTAFLPTTWTASHEDTIAALQTVARTVGPVPGGARILGAHMEGPYLAAERCGAQDPAHIRPASSGELERFLDTGAVRLLTLAPEVEGNLDAVRRCREAGVTVSIGHTSAGHADVAAAGDAGATHATHLFNAMAPLHHRHPGTVGAILAEPRLRAELIADNVHVHPLVMRLALQLKTTTGLVLVTDAVRPTGLPDGMYPLPGGRRLRHEGGVMWLEDGETLAGSGLTLDRALRNLAAATQLGIEDLWRTASLNAATAIGVADTMGRIAEGCHADLVLLDDDLTVQATVVAGHVVHRRA